MTTQIADFTDMIHTMALRGDGSILIESHNATAIRVAENAGILVREPSTSHEGSGSWYDLTEKGLSLRDRLAGQPLADATLIDVPLPALRVAARHFAARLHHWGALRGRTENMNALHGVALELNRRGSRG